MHHRLLPFVLGALVPLTATAPFVQDPAAAAKAVPPPSAEAVRSVWDFYYRGQGGGVVLGDAKLCLEVGKEGANKSEPVGEVTADGIKAGTPVIVWQAYLVPSGDAVGDVSVQLKLNGTVRESKDVGSLRGDGPRMRTWTTFAPRRAGKYTIDIVRGDAVLRSFELKVQ